MRKKTSMRATLEDQVECSLKLAECLAEGLAELATTIDIIEIPDDPKKKLQKVVSKTNNKAKNLVQETSKSLKMANSKLPVHTVRLALTET